jgi:hypothetical protein
LGLVAKVADRGWYGYPFWMGLPFGPFASPLEAIEALESGEVDRRRRAHAA